MHLIPVLLTLPFAAAPVSAPKQNAPIVHVSSGSLAGKLQGSTSVFQGIPFAAPPVGNLRWREPQAVAGWSGIRDATIPGRACVQSTFGVDTFIAPLAAEYGAPFAMEPVKSSEDCLYLNVFSPSLTTAKRLPVMVWLHGGSNRAGSGSGDGYDGSSLASHGVIVVTTNYRLGVMGFFAHPELTAESPHHSSGNYGLLDQIAGLKWVQQNIEQFGGDPRNVTLFGESAGSVDATTLMTSPLVKGLFRRVIAESGPAFGLGPVITIAAAEAVGQAVGQTAVAASHTTGTALAALRQMPAAQVAELDSRIVASRFKSFDPNGSVVDGWLLPRSPAHAFASGTIQKVDLLAGFNARELSAFRIAAAAAAKQSATPPQKEPPTTAVKKLADTAYPLYGAWTDMAVAMYLAQILVHGDVAVDRASNDMLVACPVGAETTLVSGLGPRAFLYRFDRAIPGKGEQKLGAFHALELPFVFNTFTARTWRWLPVTQADRNLSAMIELYWTNFAKFGDPNTSGLPPWKPWNSDEQPYLEFSPAAEAIPQKSFAPPFCHLSPGRLQERLAGS
jgi:para-nitrobenzyl esterase